MNFATSSPLLGAIAASMLVLPVGAQIVPDTSLPINSVATPTGDVTTITGGSESGSNLFHSFEQFNVPTNGGAVFLPAATIQNIITRVTGGGISSIDGLLQVEGAANLFLLNPNGILFGENARLNLGGSFFASTASRMRFADGTDFFAAPQGSNGNSLLSTSVPVGLGFSGTPGTIANRSQAVGLGLDGSFAEAGLQLFPGQALGFIGGEVVFEGGLATAFQGRVDIVGITDGSFQLEDGSVQGTLGDVRLAGNSRVETSGLGGGAIRLRGRAIALTQGSALVSDTLGDFDGAGIDIQAEQLEISDRAFLSSSTFGGGNGGNVAIAVADSVTITGTQPYRVLGELVQNTFDLGDREGGIFALGGGTGKAGDVSIRAPRLTMSNGSAILTTTFGTGNGGNINLDVTDTITVRDGSTFTTGTVGSGTAGDFTANTTRLLYVDGGFTNTSPASVSTGLGGNLTVTADMVELIGTPSGAPTPGGLFTTSLGANDAGDLQVRANTLRLVGGNQLSASSAGGGRGGDLTVIADTIEVRGISPDGRFLSGLFASSGLLTIVEQQGAAPSGDLSVTARQILVAEGGTISAATGSSGDAGSLTIVASESIEVTGIATEADLALELVSFGVPGDGIIPSAIESNTSGSGKAGDLNLQTGQLRVLNGGEIGVRGTGDGNAGNLQITADRILVDNTSTISAATASGEGGNIFLRSPELELRRQGQLSTRAAGSQNGGNIQIDADTIVLLENSAINANAFEGRGGNIQITTQGIFTSGTSQIAASSELGIDGVVEIEQPEIDVQEALGELSLELVNTDRVVADSCLARRNRTDNRFNITGSGGLPPTPYDPLRTQFSTTSVRSLPPQEGSGNVASNNDAPPSLGWQLGDPIQEATGMIATADGRILLGDRPPELAMAQVADIICTAIADGNRAD